MKLILTILSCLFWVSYSMAQFPNTHSQSNPRTREVFYGAISPEKGLINGRYADTATANAGYISAYPGAQIAVGDEIYHRNSTATRWILGASGSPSTSSSSITILNDSSILICNSNGCDTFKFTNIIINNFTVLNDSTILVCDGNNICDTLFVTPQPFNKTYVDSTKIVNGGIVDTLFYYINGGKYVGGYIAKNLQFQNGLISGGVATWSGTGLIIDVTAATYVKNGVIYTIPAGQVTLSPSDPDNSRIDLIAADTVANSFVTVTGVAGVVPITPQADPLSQIALTTGILLNAGDTIPSGVNSVMIYDENNAPPEWAITSQGIITYDKDNATMPYSGVRDILVSSFDATYSSLIFTGTSQSVSPDKILKFRIKLTDTLPANTSMAVWLYNGSQYVSFTGSFRNGYGFRADNIVNYQNISIPFSALSFSDSSFNKIFVEFKTTAIDNEDLYIDRVEIQNGIPNISSQIDYSNKLDSVTKSNDRLYYWAKGIRTLITEMPSETGTVIVDNGSVDSVTYSENTICQWIGGVSTCYHLSKFYDSTSLNYDSTKLIHFNSGDKVDSLSLPVTEITVDKYHIYDSLSKTLSLVISNDPTSASLDSNKTITEYAAKNYAKNYADSVGGSGTDTTSLSNRIDAKQDALSLTTTGTSGAATLTGSTLNIPQYTGGSGGTTTVNDSIAKGFLISDSGVTQSGLTPMDLTWDKVHQQRFFSVIDDNFINYKSAYEANMTFEDTTIQGTTPTITGSNLIVSGSSMMKVKTGPKAAWCAIELNLQKMTSLGSANIIGPALIKDSSNYIAGVYDAVSQTAYIKVNGTNVLTKSVNLDSSFIKLQLVITGTSVIMWAESNSNKYFIGTYNSGTLGLVADSTLKYYKYGIYALNSGGTSTNTVSLLRGGASGGGGLLNVRLVTNEDGSSYKYGNKVLFTADLEAAPNGAVSGYTNGNSSVFSMDINTFQIETVGRFYMKRSPSGTLKTLGSTNIKLAWYPSLKKWLFIYDYFDDAATVQSHNDQYAWLDYEAPFGQTILDSSQLNNFGFNTTTYPGFFYDAQVRKINGNYYVSGTYKSTPTANPIIFSGTSLSSLTTAHQYSTTTFLECGTFLKYQGNWYLNYFSYGDTKAVIFDISLDSLGVLNLPFAPSPGTNGIPGYEWLPYQKNGKTNYYLVGFDSQNLTLGGTEYQWSRGNLVVFKAQQTSVGYEFPNRIANQISFPIKDINIQKFGRFPVAGDQYLTSAAQTISGNKTFSGSGIFGTSITSPLIYGSSLSGGTVTIGSTSHATKGKILFGNSAYDEVNNRLGINTVSPLTTVEIAGVNTSNSQFKTGSLEFQTYAVNNTWFGDNTYFNGSAFLRRAAGYSGLFYFAGNEGQFRFGANSTAGSTVTQVIPFKVNLDKSVAIGGDISNAAGTYTGALMLVGATGASFGYNGAAATSTLQTTSFATAYAAKTDNYTITSGDNTIEVTLTGKTITLPTAVGITGREYTIKLTASGSTTVATTSSQTIDGSTTYSLSAQYKYVKVKSNGANWIIVGNN